MKIKQLKIINQDESTEIADIGADAINVDYNDTNVKLKLDELSNDNNRSKNNITDLQTELNTTNSNLELQTSRIDNLAHLDEGSTTGDAELIDIRTGYDGAVYSTAGNAVRGQYKNLEDIIAPVISQYSNLFNINDPNIIANKYMNTNGILFENESYSISGFIPVTPNKTYSLGTKRLTSIRFLTAFDINKVCVPLAGNENVTEWTCPTGVSFIRVSYRNDNNLVIVNEGQSFINRLKYGHFIPLSSLNISELEEKINDTFSDIIKNHPNLFNENDSDILLNKYMSSSGQLYDSELYNVSGFIPVTPGKTYCFSSSSQWTVRFITAFDIDKYSVSASGSDTAVSSWTCPPNIYYIKISYYNNVNNLMVNEGIEPLNYTPYGRYISTDNINYFEKPEYISYKGNISSNQTVTLENNSIKTYKRLSFIGDIESFESITLGHGKNDYSASYLTINSTNLIVYDYQDNIVDNIAHNLTIENNIQIYLETDIHNRAKIKIVSNGNMYENQNIHWQGWLGNIFITSNNSTLKNCKFSWTCSKFNSNIWAFGDSYFGTVDPARWIAHLLNDNHTNLLISAYGGSGSIAQKNFLITALTHGMPKKLLWCLGMNDSDTENSVNTNWYNCYNYIKQLCAINNIELILATIPNTPTRNNIYKNQIVKNSGLRYIDFANAVGASDTNSQWYNGMLSSDNVHPTENGARALYLQALADMPELMNC